MSTRPIWRGSTRLAWASTIRLRFSKRQALVFPTAPILPCRDGYASTSAVLAPPWMQRSNEKLVGPAYKEVAKKYTAADEAMLAEKVIKGSKGVWGPVPMPPNPSVTPEEANKLVKWILGLK